MVYHFCSYWVYKGQKVIETGEGDYKEEILELNKLAQILHTTWRFVRNIYLFEYDLFRKYFTHFFSVSHFPFSKRTFSSRF